MVNAVPLDAATCDARAAGDGYWGLLAVFNLQTTRLLNFCRSRCCDGALLAGGLAECAQHAFEHSCQRQAREVAISM